MIVTSFLRLPKTLFLAILLSVFLYYFFAFELVRSNFNSLIISFTGLFLLFLYLIKQNLDWRILISISILFRLLFLIATPSLSQDFYRFIWDGNMLLNGFNPYLYLPKTFLNTTYIAPTQAAELINGMGALNASNYSNYPPLNQFLFWISALFANHNILGNMVVFRVIMLLADIGIIYFGRKLLTNLNLQSNLIFLYVLNPFIIIELFGNLHFEGVMIFFLIWSLYLLQQQKWKLAAVILACSISLKLLPLLFLPLFFRYFSFKKLVFFYGIIGITLALFFIPFLSSDAITHFSKSIGLWFGVFEFNGSFYLLAREIGFEITGYNTAKLLGKITPVFVFIFVLYQSFFKKNINLIHLIKLLFYTLSFYLFTASTVHPWYIAMLLMLSVFTNYKFALLWSFTIMFSYSFYQNNEFTNNYWLIGLEYGLVFSFLVWEMFLHKKKGYYNSKPLF